MTYFLVDDTDASAAKAAGRSAATVAQAPVDTPFGRMAVVVDPRARCSRS